MDQIFSGTITDIFGKFISMLDNFALKRIQQILIKAFPGISGLMIDATAGKSMPSASVIYWAFQFFYDHG